MSKELGIGHGLIKSVMPGQSPQIRQTGMTPIENTNFCFLVRVNILCESHTHLRKIRSRSGEMIVYHPLREIFRHHRREGTRTKKGVHFALQSLRTARCDPVHHGTRKRDAVAHPFTKIPGTNQIEIGKKVALQHFAISPNVIAA